MAKYTTKIIAYCEVISCEPISYQLLSKDPTVAINDEQQIFQFFFAQFSFLASPVSINANTTELSACQKVQTLDRQTDGFQLYVLDCICLYCIVNLTNVWFPCNQIRASG